MSSVLRSRLCTVAVLVLSLESVPQFVLGQSTVFDRLTSVIHEAAQWMPQANSGVYVTPSESELRDWTAIYQFYQARSFDSCRTMLQKYNYMLLQLKDPVTGNSYDLIRERHPIQRGWGTFVHNRGWSKRIYVHVNHPLDDPQALTIGVDLFKRLNAEWLLVGGTSKRALPRRLAADVGVVKRSIFQKWHEMLTTLMHVSLSLHSYDPRAYPYPISASDIVVSNGRTWDDQWGISQLSLTFRDTMRTAGFACGLAMYDSGYARLAGGWNPQGTFSNDSVGFGHWLYVELSRKVRENPLDRSRFIAAVDRALEVTGKKISQQVNRAFGLVSPRVIRLDSLHGLFFPPANADVYRIIAFNSARKTTDTVDLRIGNWVNLSVASKTRANLAGIEPVSVRSETELHTPTKSRTVARIVEVPPAAQPSRMKYKPETVGDSLLSDEDEGRTEEPLQVHRIPLQPVLEATYPNRNPAENIVFRWDGVITGRIAPNIQIFQMTAEQPSLDDADVFPRFLIPIINSTYEDGKSRFIGVQMTNVLVAEIARLVTEHNVPEKDVGLLAEQSDGGEYHLRIFPGSIAEKHPEK